jgi:hypothetical protein
MGASSSSALQACGLCGLDVDLKLLPSSRQWLKFRIGLGARDARPELDGGSPTYVRVVGDF